MVVSKKLLFGLCMISLLLIVSIPNAEAREEEAKVLAEGLASELEEGIISPNVVHNNLGNGKYEMEISTNTEYVFEDGIWKHKSEARSLKGKGFNCEVKKYNNDTKKWKYGDDGTHKIECDDFNWTSVTFSLSYDENNLQEYNKEVKLGGEAESKCKSSLFRPLKSSL